MRRGGGGPGLAGLTIAVGSFLSCRQIVGITDSPPEALSTTVCGLPYATNACASCVNTNCCTESSACVAVPACSAYEGCLGKCNGDPVCRSKCTTYPVSTASDVSALSACLVSKCETACGLTCGGIANLISEPPSAASCQSCIEATTSACAHATACSSSVDCDGYWRCVLACPTEDCRLTCATDHTSGAALFATFQPDYAGSCSIPCAFGNYWACVGHVNYPVAKSDTITLTFPVLDFSSHSGVAGLDISICTGCPCGAAYPTLAQGHTDPNGMITLHVPQVVGGDGLGLNGCAQVTSPDMSTVPVFSSWGYPISEPVVVYTTNAPNLAPQTVTTAESAQDQALVGKTQDPMRGQVAAVIHDCLGFPSPGVQISTDSSDPLVSVWYNFGSEVTATSAGFASFYNVPPGFITLTATPLALGKPVSHFTVNVAAGTISTVGMFPTP